MNNRIDEQSLPRAVSILCETDPDLARVVARLGIPPLWQRPPGFPTLVHIILEQQVSLASAKATYDRLVHQVGELTPHALLLLDDVTLLELGFSRQKRDYARGVAQAILQGTLDLDAFPHQPDETIYRALIDLKGVGPWTAEIYLLMALGRADIWPAGDLALSVAVQEIKQLPHRPPPPQLATLAESWRPWRAVAARILWHYYLNRGT